MGFNQLAHDHFQRAAGALPDDGEIALNLGLTLHAIGKDDMASAEFTRACTLMPMPARGRVPGVFLRRMTLSMAAFFASARCFGPSTTERGTCRRGSALAAAVSCTQTAVMMHRLYCFRVQWHVGTAGEVQWILACAFAIVAGSCSTCQ